MTARIPPVVRALLALVCLALAAPAAHAEIGRVKTVAGEVTVERAGAALPARPGLTLRASDVLVTGPDGRVGVTFVDNTRMSAGPGSRIELARFRFDPTTHEGEFLTRVRRGTLAVISGQMAKHSKDAMKVETRTSVLAVRGTRFLVKVQ